jgi:hypothetical protein
MTPIRVIFNGIHCLGMHDVKIHRCTVNYNYFYVLFEVFKKKTCILVDARLLLADIIAVSILKYY